MNTYTNKDNEALKLLKAYQEGDENAFSTLYNMYIQMMLNYGQCMTTNRELVKDCIHDVFIKLLDKQNSHNINRVSSYLIISLRNRLVDEFRRDSYSSDLSLDKLVMKKSDEEVEDNYIDKENIYNIHRKVCMLMSHLTPRQREAFQLYYIKEMKYEEICEIMKLNYHSVRNLVHRGMLNLRAVALM